MKKFAIVGMDIAFEGCADVTAFERLVYAGTTPDVKPSGAPDEAAGPVRSAEQVAEGALRDAGLPASARFVTLYAHSPNNACGGSQSAATPHALVEAERLLAAGETDAVRIVEHNANGTCAVVFARDDARSPRVYATVNALRVGAADAVAATCARSLADAGVTPIDIGYLETRDCDPAQASMNGVLAAYRTAGNDLTCALGSVRVPSGTRLALAGLLKTALCLYRRYLPPATEWSRPQRPELWDDSPFYAPDVAHPWLLEVEKRRYAAVSFYADSDYAHCILAEPERRGAGISSAKISSAEISSAKLSVLCQHLAEKPLRLFPLADDRREGLHAQMVAVRREVERSGALPDLAQRAFERFRQRHNAVYAAAIVGYDKATTLREIDFALEGLNKAFESGRPWTSPQGSYFTPHPLGQEGSVAFVYPGAFNAYLEMGRDLFQIFPRLHELFAEVTARPGRTLAARRLYPRSQHPLSEAERREREAELWGDPLAMISSGTSLAILHTRLLRDIFGVQPRAALGYSLGEVSMLWALGVWRDGDAGNEAWQTSPLFTTRLCGPMEAVRAFWELPPGMEADLWHVYILKASVKRVQAQVQHEPRVYLTITNTPQEVVIAGDPQGCARVIATLDCHALRVPFDAVIHAPPVRAEHSAFADLYSHPAHTVPGVDFYSAAGYTPLMFDSATLARAMADMSCAPIDFPRLVQTAYDSGARVFVELGPQGTCSRWIRRILAGKPHAVIPINRPGAGDYETALAVLALLVSHRIPVNLSPLYLDYPTNDYLTKDYPTKDYPTNDYPTNQYLDNLSQHAARVAEGHAAFLETRQEALQQSGELLQIQAKIAQQMISTDRTDFNRISESANKRMVNGQQVVSTDRTDFNGRDAGTRTPLKHENDYPTTRLATRESSRPPLFNENHLTAFAAGSLKDCFGSMYDVFGRRRIPRIPNGDLLLMSRICEIEGQQGTVQVGASLTSEYDVPAGAWFDREGNYPGLPYAILMEIALQPCGFLSAYLGSILPHPDADFYFRNLDGEGALRSAMDVRDKTLTNRVTLTASTAIQGIIIQKYTFAVACEGVTFYKGTASFGYFTAPALENQVGLDVGQAQAPWLALAQPARQRKVNVARCLPQSGRLKLLDDAILVADGGRYGRGYVYANVSIDPQDWFFACHFHQDPVMPGSLGVEAMLQAMQVYAEEHGLGDPHGALPGQTTTWKYRGQVPPEQDKVTLEVHVSDVVAGSHITGDASLWRKGRRIYEVKGLGLQF